MKRAIVSVINDLSTDQRVHRHCMLLCGLGYDVLLIGRQMSGSAPLENRQYRMHRMRLPFEKGPLFYATFNIGLFFNQLFAKCDLLFSNDLDTLLPNFLVSRIRRKRLIYDSHECFTEVPELVSRPKVQKVWKRIERILLPRLKNTLTVNRSIAEIYRVAYGIDMKVLRNIPARTFETEGPSRQDLGLPTDLKLIILQGSGINIDRGAEEAVQSMQHVKGAVLLILGSGDVIGKLHDMVAELNLGDKVIFRDRMPYPEMMSHTRSADLGLTLDKDTNINYRFSLPNKLFDYIHAGIPVLASDLVEVSRIVKDFGVGEVVASHDPMVLAERINAMLSSDKRTLWQQNCLKAADQLNWQTESEVLEKMINHIHG